MMVLALSRYAGWGLNEVLDLTIEDLFLWFEQAMEMQKEEH